MAILDPVRTPMTDATTRALDSANPFQTPIMPTRKLDGTRVKQEPRLPIPVAEPVAPVEDKKQIESNLEPTEVIPDDVAEFLAQESAQQESPIVDKSDISQGKEHENPIKESRTQEGLPSYRCEFEGRDIFMGWPWYKTTNPVTAAVAFSIGQDFGKEKLRMDMSIGDSKIEHARNRLANKFLQTDAKWLFMIDDDIIPSIGRPFWMRHWCHAARTLEDLPLQRHILHRLMGAGKTLVAGAYFGRQEGGAIMCSDLTLAPRAKAYEDRVVPVDWVATGCMMIHRNVFQDIRKEFGDTLKIDAGEYDYDYFRPFDSKGGEDVAFCKRAKKAGHQPHIDLGVPIFHLGYKTY
jgi:hypothetical protein